MTNPWKTVPVEPTPEMLEAAHNMAGSMRFNPLGPDYWRAMLAAAPQQGWVSVEERLPDLMVPVLGYTDNGAVSVFAREDGGDGWLWARQTWVWSLADVRGIEADDDYAVIYWAPLLAPPGIKQQASDEGGGG